MAVPAAGDPVSKLAPMDQQVVGLLDFLAIRSPYMGAERTLPMRHAINAAKGATFLIVLVLMVLFRNNSYTMWTYWALHGSYAIIWTVKDYTFGDPKFAALQTKSGAIVTIVTLMMYWISPITIAASGFEASGLRIGLCVMAYCVGVTLMIGADCQKYYTLKYKKGLITEGFFAATRNPNYLGEMLLYGAFACLSNSWAPKIWLAVFWSLYFRTNMLIKDNSMSRYPDWAAYTKRSGMLLPNLNTLKEAFWASFNKRA